MWCLEGVATVRVQASPWGAVGDEAGLARAFQLYPEGLGRLENACGGCMGTAMTTAWEAETLVRLPVCTGAVTPSTIKNSIGYQPVYQYLVSLGLLFSSFNFITFHVSDSSTL